MDNNLERQFKLVQLAEEICAGTYVVEADLVADALVDRVLVGSATS